MFSFADVFTPMRGWRANVGGVRPKTVVARERAKTSLVQPVARPFAAQWFSGMLTGMLTRGHEKTPQDHLRGLGGVSG